MGKDKGDMDDVETISPEQARKEMQEAVKHMHEKEGKPAKSSTSKEHSTASKQHNTASKGDMDDVETISPEQAKKEMREAAQRAKKGQGGKKQ